MTKTFITLLIVLCYFMSMTYAQVERSSVSTSTNIHMSMNAAGNNDTTRNMQQNVMFPQDSLKDNLEKNKQSPNSAKPNKRQ